MRSPPALATLEVADADPVRAEIVESARRLVGIENSFDERSFLGHILKVNALLPSGAVPATYPASAWLKQARSDGRLLGLAEARAGDVLLFDCGDACGPASVDGVAAGVVESAAAGRCTVIAYRGGRVVRIEVAGEREGIAAGKVLGVTALVRGASGAR